MTEILETGHALTKRMAEEVGVAIKDLLVLARGNDPYSIGTPAHIRDARWFTDLFERFGFAHGVHLRRIHYQLLSYGDIKTPKGGNYENTEECWELLSLAGKQARILALVDPMAFTDMRNPPPHINYHNYASEPYVRFHEDDDARLWRCHGLSTYFTYPSTQLPEPEVVYTTDSTDQPYLLEVWIEKSTMNDVLIPICRNMDVNLVTSIGFQSLTASVNLLSRAMQSGKPAHVLYISDFDPAGKGMPVAVARQCQYQMHQRGADAELSIEQVMITPQQIREYQLPRIPIKDSDRRKAGFEDKFGTGAVELDALEALHPGEFGRHVSRAIHRYRDSSITTQIRSVATEAQGLVDEEWSAVTQDIRDEVVELSNELKVIYGEYQKPASELSAAMDKEMAPITERLRELRSEFNAVKDQFSPVLPDKPTSEPDGPLPDDPLFSSDRGYFDQLNAFNRHGGAA